MTWTSNLFICLILTTITGSGLVLFWYLVGLVIDRIGYSQLLYRLLQWLPIFFLVPVFYLTVAVRMDDGGSVDGVLGLFTDPMLYWMHVLAGLGFLGMFLMAVYFGTERRHFRRKFAACLDADLEMRSLLEECCRRLQIRQKVELRLCYGAEIPLVYGLRRPVILLPVADYPRELLEIILLHELVHVKHRDIRTKQLVVIILLVQWFNPFVWWMSALVKRWSEYACDEEVCRILGSTRLYGEVILALATAERFLPAQLFVGLLEDKHQVRRRIKRMNRNQKRKRRSARLAAALTALMMLFSAVTVYAAGDMAMSGYEALYMGSREYVSENNTTNDGLQEYTKPYNPDELNVEIGEVSMDARSTTTHFDWEVKNDIFKRSYFFNASSGGSITVAASIEPTDKTIQIGIIEPSGVNRYVNAKEDVSHKFVLDETGSYCIFVENYTGSTVYVSGYYTVRP